MKKQIPTFKSSEEAALFWEQHEILDYVDPDEFKIVHPQKSRHYSFKNPRKKSEKRLISLRVDTRLLQRARVVASRKQTGYQTVLRNWLEKGAA